MRSGINFDQPLLIASLPAAPIDMGGAEVQRRARTRVYQLLMSTWDASKYAQKDDGLRTPDKVVLELKVPNNGPRVLISWGFKTNAVYLN